MVFDVPAERGGALSILLDFYNQILDGNDKNINWFFVISSPKLEEKNNIKVLRFPWIKKSWIHRYYFDQIIAPRLVKKYEIDKIFSLQNITIPRSKCRQMLYVHQALPFVDYKFSFKENKILWMYQNIIGRKIIHSIKKADQVIVQTHWMKKACIEKAQVESEKIVVKPPKINISVKSLFQLNESSKRTFFYPAGGNYYKNHRVIVEACEKLKESGISNFKVVFTLNKDENKHIFDLFSKSHKKGLPINFIGKISREEVFDFYTRSILIFPSYIETFGLPMLEARLHNGIILAADSLFSHEVLDSYSNAYFFDRSDSKKLASLMRDIMENRIQLRLVNNK